MVGATKRAHKTWWKFRRQEEEASNAGAFLREDDDAEDRNVDNDGRRAASGGRSSSEELKTGAAFPMGTLKCAHNDVKARRETRRGQRDRAVLRERRHQRTTHRHRPKAGQGVEQPRRRQ